MTTKYVIGIFFFQQGLHPNLHVVDVMTNHLIDGNALSKYKY